MVRSHEYIRFADEFEKAVKEVDKKTVLEKAISIMKKERLPGICWSLAYAIIRVSGIEYVGELYNHGDWNFLYGYNGMFPEMRLVAIKNGADINRSWWWGSDEIDMRIKTLNDMLELYKNK